MKIRDKQRWLSNQMFWLAKNNQLFDLFFTLVLLFSILPNCSHGFKYIALASTSKVNATSPEIQFHVNNVTLTDNTISDNDSEEGHAKVVKTISSLLAESLNKSIGHFQYIQDNRDSTSSERQLRLSLTTTTSTSTTTDEGNGNSHKEPCTESRRFDDTLEDDDNSDESKSAILGNSAKGLNDSIISVTLTSKTVSDGLQDDKTGPTTINPSNLVTRVTGSSILTDKIASVYYGDEDGDDTSNDSGDIQKMNNGDEMNLRKYFKPISTTLPPALPDPSPVYQPEEAVKVVPIGQNNGNQNVNHKKHGNNGTQFICIKVINGKLTYPTMAKLIYPQLKERSLVMPTVPKIPLSYMSFKKYDANDSYNDSSTESISIGTSDSVIELNKETKLAKQSNSFGISGRQAKHYIQRYYPVNLYSLDSIQKKNVSYTLASSLSFDPGDNETNYLHNRRRSSVTANIDAATESVTNINTTTPTIIEPLVSEKPADLNTFNRPDNDKIKYKPITYKTTVIIPKITTTTVSLSTNYPKSSSAEPLTTTTPLPSSTEVSSIHSSNKIIHELNDKKDSKYEINKKRQDKESVKSNKKSDKSIKKEIQMMNSGSSISSQRLVSSRIRFPDSISVNIEPKSTPIDTSFDSFEITSEEPMIIPNSMMRPPFGLTTIVPHGLQHQISASNPNQFQSHHHFNNVNHHQKKYQQLSSPITVNQHSLIPEVLLSSIIMPNELTDNPLNSLMNPSIGSAYRGLTSKLKSAINFAPKQQQQVYPNQQNHHNSYSLVPSSNQMTFGYNGYDQSGLESVYKLNPHSNTNDMLYYDPRLNYKPEVNYMVPYLPNLQGSYVRQPASKFLRQYQALVTSASSMVQRNPSQSIQFNPNHSQMSRQPLQTQLQHNRQQLIPPTNFYPVFQPIQSVSLNPQTFQDPLQIHQQSNYYYHQHDLRPKVSASIHHKLKPEHINLLEQGDSSSISSLSRVSLAASGSKLSSPSSEGSMFDDKQSNKSSRKNRSKNGSNFRSRNSKSKSKRKNKQNNLSGNSSLLSKSPKSLTTSLSIETVQKSSPKTLSDPCSSLTDSTNCQSLGGLLFNPSRSVKFELRDALS